MHTTARFVEFRSGRNVLRGMIHRPRTRKAVPGVVLLHGFSGQRMGSHYILVKAARALAGCGIAAMRFDFAGSGESEGRFQDMSVLTELDDARRALRYLARSRGVDAGRLGVLGHSLGGCVAGMLLEDLRLKAGVLWAPVADLVPLAEVAAPPFTQRQLDRKGYVEFGAHRIGRVFVEDAPKADPASLVGRSRADILVIHGAEDESVPLEHARVLARAAGARTNGARAELVVLRGAGHTFERVRHEEEVIRRTAEWFVTSLDGRHAGKGASAKGSRGKRRSRDGH